MTMIQIILASGIVAGLTAVLIAYFAERVSRTQDGKHPDPFVPRTPWAGIGAFAGPQQLIARIGRNDPVHMTLNTVVMRPTKGLRFMSIVPAALVLWFVWGPPGVGLFQDILPQIMITCAVLYGAWFIAGYEARYDAEGLTVTYAPLRTKHHRWEDFISIKDDGHLQYQLLFETGRVSMQKHLVGMPTFLTFITEVREMNARL